MQDVYDRLDELGIEPSGPEESQPDRGREPNGDENASLQSEIVRRAGELRREWGWDPEQDAKQQDAEQPGLEDEAGPMGQSNRESDAASLASRRPASETATTEDAADGSDPEEGSAQSSSRPPTESQPQSSPRSSHSSGASETENEEGSATDNQPSAVDIQRSTSSRRGNAQSPINMRDLFSEVDDEQIDPAAHEFESVDEIPDDVLWNALDFHLPADEAINRETLLKRAANSLGHPLSSSLRSRLNKFMNRRINAGQLEQIKKEQIRRAR